MGFQPLLKKIHFMMTKYIRLYLVLVDPDIADSIGPEFPLRSKFIIGEFFSGFSFRKNCFS